MYGERGYFSARTRSFRLGVAPWRAQAGASAGGRRWRQTVPTHDLGYLR
jgi:hypothetical protein